MEKNKKKFNLNPRLIVFIILFLICISIAVYIFFAKDLLIKDNNVGVANVLNNIQIEKTQITAEKTERMLQLEELKKENQDIIGWLEIEGTNINYPVLQTTDNSFYMTHDYKKEYNKNGSLFLDKDYNWDLPSSNLLIYGHNNRNGVMFDNLMKYKDEDFYKEHPTIKFTTNKEDVEYEIIAVFLSRVYYKSEKDVFRYYYFVNAENEEEFNEFVKNSKNASLYDTGKTAEYGDQLMTLSTCEYSQEDGRFAVVAKKVK